MNRIILVVRSGIIGSRRRIESSESPGFMDLILAWISAFGRVRSHRCVAVAGGCWGQSSIAYHGAGGATR